MEIILRSEIEEHLIKLPQWVKIPDGTKVRVKIETEMSKEEKMKLAEALKGSWVSDPSLPSIFEEIEKERHNYFGRSIELNVSN